ncbi:MAG: hypothetical protein NC236_01855 [Mycoplasma sp.]|nr:hypothetical protein [Mycoplasma sp.]
MKVKIKNFIEVQINELKKRRKKYFMWWRFLSAVVFFMNICTVIFSCIALDFTINDYLENHHFYNLISDIGLTVGVAIISIILFFVSINATILQSTSKRKKYRHAIEDIQYITLLYVHKKSNYSGKDRDEIFMNDLLKIKEKYRTKEKLGIKKIFQIIVRGDTDE